MGGVLNTPPIYKKFMEIIIRSRSKSGKISKENQAEWHNERRAKMLASGMVNGIKYKPENVAAMMYSKENNIREHHVRKMIKKEVNPREMKYNQHI